MLVENKTAVITGAASGIGAATAKLYADSGANVVAVDIDDDGGQATVDTIVSGGGEAMFVQADVSDSADVQHAIEAAVEEYGGLDVLFNNAGIVGTRSGLEEFGDDDFDSVVAVNLKGVFYGLKYGTQAMLADEGGSIINTSSVAANVGFPGRCAYCATKAGINGMSRSAAIEFAEAGIRVNTVLPGIVETPMHHQAGDQTPATDRTSLDLSEPMSGTEQPEDIAEAVLFLGSDHSSRITGVELPVDGGILARP